MADGDIRYINGFESGNGLHEALTHTTTGGTVECEEAYARAPGVYSLRVNRTSGALACCTVGLTNSTPEGNACWPTGIRKMSWAISVYVSQLPSAGNVAIFSMVHFSGNDVEMYLNSSGQLTFTVVGQPTLGPIGILKVNDWNLIEGYDDSSATGHKVYVRLNGATPFASTTGAEAANDINGFILGINDVDVGTFDLYFDDFVCIEGLSFIGDHRVLALTADGTVPDIDSNWTIETGEVTRAQALDDLPADDFTSFIGSITSGQTQQIPIATTTVPGTIVGVNQRGRVVSDLDTGVRLFTTNLRNGANGPDGPSATWSYDATFFLKTHYGTPQKMAPGDYRWTQEHIDNLVVRLVKDANTNEVDITTVWCDVAYRPIVTVATPSYPVEVFLRP